MSQRVRISILVLLATTFGNWCRGETPAEKFANQIQSYNEAAAARQIDLANLVTLAAQLPDMGKKDMALITAYMNEESAAWTKAADLLKTGDEPTSTKLVKRVQEMQRTNVRWTERLTARFHQAQINEYLPANEDSYDALIGGMKDADAKEVMALMEVKKRRSEAFGRLADATTPNADPSQIYKLKDEVDACDVEVSIADLKMGWAREDRYARMYILNDPKISSDRLSIAFQKLTDWRTRYEETFRQSHRAQHELEREKRNYEALINERNESFNAARAATNRAPQGK